MRGEVLANAGSGSESVSGATEVEKVEESVLGALQVEGAETDRGRALVIGFVVISAVEGLGGGAIQAIEGEIEDGAVGFSCASVGGGEDVFEAGADAESIEDGGETIVEV